MKEFERICGFERLAQLEQLLYGALKYDDDECSVSSSWKYYGMLRNEFNHLYFMEGVLTESEFHILADYLFDFPYSDCYNNMMTRMKVRDKDER